MPKPVKKSMAVRMLKYCLVFPAGMSCSHQENDKSFALLMKALAGADEAAMVRVSIRGSVAKWAAITPDGYLRIVHSQDQMRAPIDMPTADLAEAEVDMARTLLDAIPTTDVTTMTDDSSERVEAYVEEKLITMLEDGEVEAPKQRTATPVPDVMAQLQASIDAKKAERAA